MQVIDQLQKRKYKLLLLIGRPGSGKSKFLHNYSKDKGIPILDFDLILGEHLPENKDASYVYDFVRDFLKTYTPQEILLDKKKILYQKDSGIDLLDFLKELSTNKVVIATWNGYTKGDKLIHVCNSLNQEIEYDLSTLDCAYMELQ